MEKDKSLPPNGSQFRVDNVKRSEGKERLNGHRDCSYLPILSSLVSMWLQIPKMISQRIKLSLTIALKKNVNRYIYDINSMISWQWKGKPNVTEQKLRGIKPSISPYWYYQRLRILIFSRNYTSSSNTLVWMQISSNKFESLWTFLITFVSSAEHNVNVKVFFQSFRIFNPIGLWLSKGGLSSSPVVKVALSMFHVSDP